MEHLRSGGFLLTFSDNFYVKLGAGVASYPIHLTFIPIMSEVSTVLLVFSNTLEHSQDSDYYSKRTKS